MKTTIAIIEASRSLVHWLRERLRFAPDDIDGAARLARELDDLLGGGCDAVTIRLISDAGVSDTAGDAGRLANGRPIGGVDGTDGMADSTVGGNTVAGMAGSGVSGNSTAGNSADSGRLAAGAANIKVADGSATIPPFPSIPEPEVITSAGLVIDPAHRSVTRDGVPITLTPKEFDILYFLAYNRGIVFTKEQIYRAVWQGDYVLDGSNIMAFIRKLRKKIEPNPDAPEYIMTIWGVGYRFNDRP